MQHAVKRRLQRLPGERGEQLLGLRLVARIRGVAQLLRRLGVLGQLRCLQRLEHILCVEAVLFRIKRIAIEHFQNRQCLLSLGHFLGHIKRWRQRHESVEAVIIFTAKRTRIGQRTGGHELAQRCAGIQFANHLRQKLRGRRGLHQVHQRLKFSKRQTRGVLGGHGGGHADVAGQRGAEAGDEHALANVREKFAAGVGVHEFSFGVVLQWRHQPSPAAGQSLVSC